MGVTRRLLAGSRHGLCFPINKIMIRQGSFLPSNQCRNTFNNSLNSMTNKVKPCHSIIFLRRIRIHTFWLKNKKKKGGGKPF